MIKAKWREGGPSSQGIEMWAELDLENITLEFHDNGEKIKEMSLGSFIELAASKMLWLEERIDKIEHETSTWKP